MKLSIIIPVYNEEKTILKIINEVDKVNLPDIEKEIIIVDDGSTDETRNRLKAAGDKHKIIFKEKNEGKGSAVIKGFLESTGDIVMIQDADLEYDPSEIAGLIKPIIDDKADVVYGSRFLTHKPRRVFFFWHQVGNKLLTLFSNMLTNLTLTDMETCYKAFRREVIDEIKHKLRSKKFGIEPELTAAISRNNWRIYEVGISYSGRPYSEGKKIGWRDGAAAIWHIIKFNWVYRK